MSSNTQGADSIQETPMSDHDETIRRETEAPEQLSEDQEVLESRAKDLKYERLKVQLIALQTT